MKTLSLLSASAYTAIIFLGVVGSEFTVTVDAAELSAATGAGGDRSAPSPSLFTKSKTLLSKLNPRAIYPSAIGRDDAVTHSGTIGGSLHGIVGQVERNLASRRLLINQDEAAERVRDAIAAANQAVDNGETSGVALPLDYVQLSKQLGYEQQLTVRLRLPGVDRDLNVLVDTGSSALAFCNNSLIDEAKNISKTNYAQCESYGSTASCPDGSTGKWNGFAGEVFRGDVAAYNDQGEEVASMDNVSFATMEFAQAYFCLGPLDGIIGVAYEALNINKAVEIPSPDFAMSSLWNEKCVNPNQVDFSHGFKTIGNCDTGNMTQVNLNPPLQQALQQDYNSGQITAAAFGLYLDYAAAMGSKVDMVVPSLGIYYGGDLAYDNPFYNNGKVQVAKTTSFKTVDYGDIFAWYQLNFTSIRVPGSSPSFTQSTIDLCKQPAKCITDTGNSWLKLPLPQNYCESLRTGVDELKEAGSLFIDLTAADGKDDITLSFPLLWLAEQYVLGHVQCTSTTGSFVLGLPIRQFYYSVYDMGNKTVSFVELNLSNETQAFLGGQELGGLNPPKNEEPDDDEETADNTTTPQQTPQPSSMGCFHHTIGLGLLAWTVFVPSAAALIASL